MKALYIVSDVINSWFATYHIYHIKKLGIRKSIYNSYFLHKTGSFDIIGMQTDDTLIFADNKFALKKYEAIQFAKIMI